MFIDGAVDDVGMREVAHKEVFRVLKGSSITSSGGQMGGNGSSRSFCRRFCFASAKSYSLDSQMNLPGWYWQ